MLSRLLIVDESHMLTLLTPYAISYLYKMNSLSMSKREEIIKAEQYSAYRKNLCILSHTLGHTHL